MISKKEVSIELVKMSLAFPASRYTNEEMEILAETWAQGLIDISPEVFVEACNLHRKASDFFPTIHEILECCSSVWEERRRSIKKLPEPVIELTPKQVKENIDKVRSVIREAQKDFTNKQRRGSIKKKSGVISTSMATIKEKVRRKLDDYYASQEKM